MYSENPPFRILELENSLKKKKNTRKYISPKNSREVRDKAQVCESVIRE